MKNNIKMIVIILIGIIALYFFRFSNSDYNLNKTISACIVAQKQTSKSFDLNKAKKYCEDEIKKRIKGSK